VLKGILLAHFCAYPLLWAGAQAPDVFHLSVQPEQCVVASGQSLQERLTGSCIYVYILGWVVGLEGTLQDY
jgi:hypothetical protein